MPKITFLPHKDLCPDGLEIEVEEGISICDIASVSYTHLRAHET